MSAGAGVKLVFIDIDGVMNNTADGTSYLSYDPKRYGLSKRNVFALRRILKRTGAKLVLSTSWRNHPPDYCHQYRGLLFRSPLKRFVRAIGKRSFFWDGAAPHMAGFQKYYDILGFFYRNGLGVGETRFAVLDDQANQLLEKFSESFFLIDGRTGLTGSVAEGVIAHLNREERPC